MPVPLTGPRPNTQKAAAPTWKEAKSFYDPESAKYAGDATLPREATELDTFLQYFRYFITPEIVEYITKSTSLYSVQCQPNKPVCATVAEIEQF